MTLTVILKTFKVNMIYTLMLILKFTLMLITLRLIFTYFSFSGRFPKVNLNNFYVNLGINLRM